MVAGVGKLPNPDVREKILYHLAKRSLVQVVVGHIEYGTVPHIDYGDVFPTVTVQETDLLGQFALTVQ
jgi:hypothetical protein